MKPENLQTAPNISDTEKKLLELLVTGASSKSIAEQMGLKDGTTRVYLHSLYKRIGVNNKTSAVTWYLDIQRAAADKRPAATQGWDTESFGDRAVRRNLLSALGMMEVFLGPYGRMWDMLATLGGEHLPTQDVTYVRERARHLWNAFVSGNFGESATYFDQEGTAKLFIESPSDAVVLAASLLLGGFTARASRTVSSLKLKRGGSIGITADERAALAAIGDVVNDHELESALAALHRLAERSQRRPIFRHLLIVTLFHVYRMRGQASLASDVGNAIWIEAEAARHQLQSVGDSTFPSDARIPAPPKLAKAEVARYLAQHTA